MILILASLLSVPLSVWGSSSILENSSKFNLEQGDYTLINHIHIWSNDDFVNFNFPGTGIEEDPYIIEGYDITTLEDDLIFISDTDVYFEIINNLISGENSNNLYGIRLINTQNGLIENNIITEADDNGISIQNSDNLIFRNNYIGINNNWGIFLDRSTEIQFIDNVIEANGFEGVGSYNSNNNYWMNNTITNHPEHGVRFELTNSNIFLGNIVNSNGAAGIWLGEAHSNVVQLNSFTNNGAGVPISHDDTTGSSTNNLVFENEMTNNLFGISLWDGQTNNITNNIITNSLSDALRLDNSFENIIEFNLINRTLNIGISLAGGQDNIITNNIISNGGFGLDISEGSTVDEINCNLFEQNFQYGISLSSNTQSEMIFQNDFVNNQNSPQASDDGTSNTFENNFWNELEVENQFTVYAISGSSDNVDSTSVMERNTNSQDINSICYVGPKSTFIGRSQEDEQIKTSIEDIIPRAELIFPDSNPVIIGLIALLFAVPSVVIFYRRKSNTSSELQILEKINDVGFDDYEAIGSITRTPVSGLCRVCGNYASTDIKFCSNCKNMFD